MEGKERRPWLMFLWLCFGSTLVLSLTAGVENSDNQQQPNLKLDVADLDAPTYVDFIENLRNQLRDPNEDVDHWHGFNVLRTAGDLLLVELVNGETESITLAINVTTVYVIAYRAENHAHYFPSTPESEVQNAFPDVAPKNRHQLPFRENYDSLESAAHALREEIDLGADPLQNAVSQLYYDSRSRPINYQTQERVARNLIICIQMISESARNFIIAGRISTWIHNSEQHPPEPDMIEYENSWGKLSERIQESGENGIFDGTQIVDRHNQHIIVSNVNDFYVRFAIALMKYYCQPQQQIQYSPFMINMPIVAINDDTCDNPEDPIVRIAGPNGLCAEVKDSDYHNGNGIHLQPCKDNSDVNQLWTFKRNGMIQSNDKCLTSYGYNPGDYMMIYDCPSQVTGATHWQAWDNGTFISRSGLVLAATSGDKGTLLTVETNNYTTSQSWRPTSYAKPFVTSIVGLNDLCLQATGNNVWLEQCTADKAEQTWILYPDSSIRPQQNQDGCLSGGAEHGIIVEIVPCNLLSAGQRWVFKSDRTIVNLNYDGVLDVAYSDPAIKRIIVWSSTGNANQKWSPVF